MGRHRAARHYSGYELRDCWPSHIHAIWELSTLTAAWPVLCLRCRVGMQLLRNLNPLGPDPAPASMAKGGPMPGVELSTSACDGHVVVALSGDRDITDAANAGAAIAALVVPGRCLIVDMAALDFIDCGSLAGMPPRASAGWRTGPGRAGRGGPMTWRSSWPPSSRRRPGWG